MPVLLLVVLLALAGPGAVVAQADTQAPPGLSGADQYLETVPGSGGNSSVGNGQQPKLDDPTVKAAAAASIPKAAVAQLERAGRPGRDAAALAARTAPAAPKRTASTRPAVAPSALSPNGSPLAAIGRIATGSGGGGMGLLFPLLLIAGTLAVAGSVIWRRRGGDLAT